MSVFDIFPSVAMRQNVLGRATGEGRHLLRFGLGFGTCFNGIDTGFYLPSMLGVLIAGLKLSIRLKQAKAIFFPYSRLSGCGA